MRELFSERTRAYIYRVLIAVGAVLTAYGVLSSEQLAVWLGVAIAVLNVMPSVNTSTHPDDPAV